MKVFSIYLDDTKGHLILCGETKKESLEYFHTQLGECNLDEVMLRGVQIDVYEEPTLLTTHTKPCVISYCINL